MEPLKKRYLGLLAVLGIGVCLIAWIVTRGARENQRLKARISEKIAAIKSAGSPVTAEDLVRLNPNPLPEQDATLVLGRVFAMTANPPQGSNVPLLGGKLPEGAADMDDETRTAIQQFLESNRSALAALPPAIEDTWFPGFFANGFTNTTKLPLVEIRRLVQILCVNAMAQAETNEALGCVQSLRQSFQVARTLRSDSMVGHMIRRAVEGMTCTALERCMNRARLSDQQLVALTAVVTNIHPEGFKSALETERAFGIWAMKTFQATTQQKTSRWADLLDIFLARRFYKDEDFLLYLDRADFYFHALDQPFPARLQSIAARERDMQKTKSRSVFNIPHWAKAARSDAEIQTHLFVASVALAVERYRLGHDGRLPNGLSELFPDYLPAVPRDPFGTDLLRYKQLKSGFIVYSIGQDGHDDEGAEKRHQAPDATPYDLPLTIER